MLALRRMSNAFGGVPKLAEQAELNVNTLYRTLSSKGNPELKSRELSCERWECSLRSARCGNAWRESPI